MCVVYEGDMGITLAVPKKPSKSGDVQSNDSNSINLLTGANNETAFIALGRRF